MSARKQRATARTTRSSETPDVTFGSQSSQSFRETSFSKIGGRSRRISEGEESLSNSSGSGMNTTRHSRLEEKEFLGSLNSRLAMYIDRVRQLEQENNRLMVQIKDIEVVEKKEKSNIQERYEAEKDRLRRQLDGLHAKITKLEIERDSAVANYEELFGRVGRLERDLKTAENARLSAQNMVENFQARINSAENKLASVEAENDELAKENDRLRKQLSACQKHLEEESLLRAELQNKLSTALEDLAFERDNHRQQVEDVRRKRQVDMTAYSKQLETDYEAQLNERLVQMRAEFADQLSANRAAFEEQFSNKLNDAREMAERFRDEASRLRIRVQDLETSGAASEGQLESMRRKISGLEAEVERLRREMNEKLAHKDERIFELNQEIQRMMNEYHDLIDLKIQLDAELKAYQTLLEGEESRLNLTANSSPNVSTHHVSFSTGSGFASAGSSSAQRGTKRRRTGADDEFDYSHLQQKFESGATGPISIEGADAEGKSVTLINTSDEDVHIGGWQLKVSADAREVSYKFHNKMNFKAGSTITVWSSDAGVAHKPPSALVMKNQQWPIGTNPEAALLNEEEDKIAWMVATADFRADGANPSDRCSIM